MATLYLIQGFIGAGKSTFSKKLAEQTSAIRLNADEWVELNFSEQEKREQWDNCFGTAVSILHDQATDFLNDNKDVILDFGFWTKESRDYARQIAKSCGANSQLFYLNTSDQVLLQRLKERTGPIAEYNIENFDKIKRTFEPPTQAENPIIIYESQMPTFAGMTVG